MSHNFDFLKEHNALFIQLATTAELSFVSDPNTTVIKLRQLGEAFAQHIATLCGISFNDQTSQADLLYHINKELNLDSSVRHLFHTLRMEGNKAAHQFKTAHKEALDTLKVARQLAIWFHQSFGKQGTNFKPQAFVPPTDPSEQLRKLQTEIEQLKTHLLTANQQLDSHHKLTELLAQEKSEYEQLADEMDKEAKAYAAQAEQHEQNLLAQQQAYEKSLKALQQQLASQSQQLMSQQKQKIYKSSSLASQNLSLDEELTRILIDQQLIEAGWQADSQQCVYEKGTRPEKGVNRAIAEWPTEYQGKKGRADYVLFHGLTPIAVVEAKRENANVAGKIPQAQRYAKGFKIQPPLQGAWLIQAKPSAWDEDYQIPFVYSCNGRPYIPQLAEQSGTWFRDVRELNNLAGHYNNFIHPMACLICSNAVKSRPSKCYSKKALLI